MFKPQQFKAKLADKQVFNDKYSQYNFTLVAPHQMEFDPGQYVSIVVDEHGDRRSYSIASKPENKDGFELLVDHTPQGSGTKLLQNLEFGAEINVMGPLGRFTFNKDEAVDELVFVATGSGIAPFRSMILSMLQEGTEKRNITLYWGMRHVEELFWQNDFQDLAESFSNFHFHPVISQAIEEWPLCRGRVTDCLRIHEIPVNGGYYLCGNAHMIQDVTALLEEKGVPNEHVHFEKFF